jgi:uracil-DNA glycosylase
MSVKIHPQWKIVLYNNFDHPYFKTLISFVKSAYQKEQCYPPGELIFNAFDLCPPKQTRVVLLGQDPYHGDGQAHGLCFSVPKGVTHPPSLINIFKELAKDIGCDYPKNGELSCWAKQGVLLLNSTLTVAAGKAGSHQGKGWEIFTDRVIRTLSNDYEGIVFMLWGGYARQKTKLIDAEKHFILTSGHPSPLSANRGYWFGNKHFSQCNEYLISKGKIPIEWSRVI